MSADPWALSPATQQAIAEARTGWADSYACHHDDDMAWEAAIEALTAGTLRLLTAERTTADAAALYHRTQEVHMARKAGKGNPDSDSAKSSRKHNADRDAKHWRGRADRAEAAGDTAAAAAHRAHADRREADGNR